MNKTQALLRVGSAYVGAVAAGAIWLVWGPETHWLLVDTLIADVVATVVVFVFSRVHGNSSFYDAYWSVIPPLVTLYWWAQSGAGADDGRSWLVASLILLWAIRLTGNWVYAFPGLHHEDWRYPLLRDRSGRWEFLTDLFAIHLIPTLQVYLALIPVYVVVTRSAPGVGWLDAVALFVGLGAVLLEAVADLQMHRFARRRQPGQVMAIGLWAWSRHPNYFGEFSFWLSLAIFGAAASPADAWWMFAGAAAMLAMFLGVSIPLMEERSLERRPTYQQVVEGVPRFVPRPPRHHLPHDD
jgi:steroid 5-alpha reductase family enzyme